MSTRGRTHRLAGIKNWHDATESLDAAVRESDRARGIVQPTAMGDISLLPPARDYEGRIYYIGGTTKHLYMSDGANWRQITIV